MESFNGKFRDEFLNGEIFYTLREAKVLTGISILSFTFTRKPMPLTLSCQSQIGPGPL